MDMAERMKLKERYAAMPDEGLIELLLVDKEEYNPEAYELLCAEADKRGLQEKIEELKKTNKEPVEVEISPEEIKCAEYVPIMIVTDPYDMDSLEKILTRNDIPYTFDTMSLAGNNFPSSLTVEKSRVSDAIRLLKDFKPKKGSLILW
jgi:hypothetical protein